MLAHQTRAPLVVSRWLFAVHAADALELRIGHAVLLRVFRIMHVAPFSKSHYWKIADQIVQGYVK